MSDLPYTKAILRLAADATGAGRLAAPDGSHTEHNPACGDRATVDLQIENGHVTAMAHDTRACVLAQASASILGSALPGCTLAELAKLRADIVAMFETGAPPDAPFAGYAALQSVAQFPGRHRCVLLLLDAALKAWESQAREPSGQGTKA